MARGGAPLYYLDGDRCGKVLMRAIPFLTPTTPTTYVVCVYRAAVWDRLHPTSSYYVQDVEATVHFCNHRNTSRVIIE
jgi:hypothetical protein